MGEPSVWYNLPRYYTGVTDLVLQFLLLLSRVIEHNDTQ